jgi:molecular chaperone GrpE (heat shock protein)
VVNEQEAGRYDAGGEFDEHSSGIGGPSHRTEPPDGGAGEKQSALLSDISKQLGEIRAKLTDVDTALAAVKPSSTSEQVLIQVLTVSRETLAKVSAPAETATDLIEPLVRDLVGWVSNVDALLVAQRNAQQGNQTNDLATFQLFLIDILERYGVELEVPEIGSFFVSAEAQAMKSEPVSNEDESGRITRVVRRGCSLRGKRLFYPQVNVARYSPKPETA